MEHNKILIKRVLRGSAGILLAGLVAFVVPLWGADQGDRVSINIDTTAASDSVSDEDSGPTTAKVNPRRGGSRLPSERSDPSQEEEQQEAEPNDDDEDDEEEGGERDLDPKKNLVAQHDSSSEQYKKKCSECHRDVHSRQSMDPSVPTAHRVMFPYAAGKPGDDKQCRWCHHTVDLVQGTQLEASSTGSLRRHTDVLLCTLCHGPYRGPGQQLYQGGLSPTDPDGPLLYNLVCAGCHGPLDSSKVGGEDADDIQKKIDEDEGGMGPLSVLTTAEIDAIAAALAE